MRLYDLPEISIEMGIMIITYKNLQKDVVNVRRNWILFIKLVLGEEIINMLNFYTSQAGLDASKKKLWQFTWKIQQNIVGREKLFIGVDLNERVGESRDGFEDVNGDMILKIEVNVKMIFWDSLSLIT